MRPVEPYRSRQRYGKAGCLLETEFGLPGGRRLRLTDFMPVLDARTPERPPLLVRRVEAFGGPASLEFECVPAFDYGRRPHVWRLQADRAVAHADVGQLTVLGDRALRADGPLVRSSVRLGPGRVSHWVIAWGSVPRGRFDPGELYRSTKQFWQDWAHRPDSPVHQIAHRWHRWVLRSELTLKMLSVAHTGAFVAAPTTSVPEYPGGTRNWDYRYVWIRDAAFAAQTLLNLGHLEEARAFLRWVLLRVREDSTHRLRVVYGAHGETDLRERELRHWSGVWNSRPVRIGNGAANQFQLDIYGELLDAALLLDEVDVEFVTDHWQELAAIAQIVVRRWRYPDNGIWEQRGPSRQFVHSKLMAWVALDRASRLAERHGSRDVLEAWANEAQKIRAWILAEGFDARRRTFLQAAGAPAVDAANLRLPLVGFLPFDDPSVLGTIDAVERELAVGAFVYRYRAPDGLAGPEGAFLPASFWLVECLARVGALDRAEANWDQLLKAGNTLGLFSEEYRPETRTMLGNFPQALTHVALLRAAIALGEASRARASPADLAGEGVAAARGQRLGGSSRGAGRRNDSGRGNSGPGRI